MAKPHEYFVYAVCVLVVLLLLNNPVSQITGIKSIGYYIFQAMFVAAYGGRYVQDRGFRKGSVAVLMTIGITVILAMATAIEFSSSSSSPSKELPQPYSNIAKLLAILGILLPVAVMHLSRSILKRRNPSNW